MTESFAELFEESLANQELRRGAVVTGTVVDIQSDSVVVNAGLKSEGIIPIVQFRNSQGELEVEVGDEVEVSLEAIEEQILLIKHQLRATGERELPSREVGELVMQALKALDQVAYVRFASVYRSFQDLSEFRDAIERLEAEPADNES